MPMKIGFGGEIYDLLRPESARVSPVRIANTLSRIIRYNGETGFPVSVLSHSMSVSSVLGGRNEVKLAGLMHDAHEAFIGDLSTPTMKALECDPAPLKALWDAHIAACLQLPPITQAERDAVKLADRAILAAEIELFFEGGEEYAAKNNLWEGISPDMRVDVIYRARCHYSRPAFLYRARYHYSVQAFLDRFSTLHPIYNPYGTLKCPE